MIVTVLLASFIASLLACWAFSCYGRALFAARPRDWTPERHHQTKQGIPTMGGLVLLWVWFVGILSPWAPEPWAVTAVAAWVFCSMAALGAYDDWSKIIRRGGISAQLKFIAQNACALAGAVAWYWANPAIAGYLWIPLFDVSLYLGPLMVIWATFIMVAASNAVNLTDGLDGLAGTVLTVCFGAIVLCAHILGHSDVVYGALLAVGVLLGFVCFNWHPARLFMGDTGALAFGSLLGFYAVQLNITLLLPFIAIIPVVETVSVMLQVAWYKRYQTRIFKMAPLHHHFELLGWSEQAISIGAGLITLIFSAIALLFVLYKN